MTLEEMRTALKDVDVQAMSPKCGVGTNTLYKIRNGRPVNLTMKTMRLISDYLEGANGN